MTSPASLWRAGLILMILIGVFAMAPKPAVAEMPPALYRLGVPAAAGAVSVTVSSADVFTRSAGRTGFRLVVQYTIKNISYDPVPVDDHSPDTAARSEGWSP